MGAAAAESPGDVHRERVAGDRAHGEADGANLDGVVPLTGSARCAGTRTDEVGPAIWSEADLPPRQTSDLPSGPDDVASEHAAFGCDPDTRWQPVGSGHWGHRTWGRGGESQCEDERDEHGASGECERFQARPWLGLFA